MFVTKKTLGRAVDAARAELAEKVRRWRRVATQQSARAIRAESERDAALRRAESAETKYGTLVERLLTPPKLIAPAPHAPLDPEVASLDRLGDDTVKRMAEQFTRDGLSPEVAEAHARELVGAAERMWGGTET